MKDKTEPDGRFAGHPYRSTAAMWIAALAVGWLLMTTSELPAEHASVNHPGAAEEARKSAVDALFQDFDQPDTPGGAIGIHRSGRSLYTRAYGLADLEHDIPVKPQTRFMVGSVSKQFAAFSIALLAEEGKVDLDAAVRSYLPDLPDAAETVTVRQLVHHTSGLRDQAGLIRLAGHSIGDVLTQRHMVNLASRQRELNFEPGSEYLYSNTGYSLLAEIVHVVSGQTLRQYTREQIFEPLGMSRTFFYDDLTEIVPDRAESYVKGGADGSWRRARLNYDVIGATGLLTTVGDMLRWAGNFTVPVVGDARLIEKVGAAGALRDGTSINYGFGLMRHTFAGHEALVHGGTDAGYRALFAHFPAHDFSVVLLANNSAASLSASLTEIVRLYLNNGVEEASAAAPGTIAPPSALLHELEGHYLRPFEPMISLERDRDQLFWKTAGSESVAVVFRADGTFDLGDRESAGTVYRPRRDGNGRLVAIENISARAFGRHERYVRTDRLLPAIATLAELEGDYYSRELDVTYTFAVEDGRLAASALWLRQPVMFEPTVADRFDSLHLPLSMTVERDPHGCATGLRIHTGRIRNLLLERERRSAYGRSAGCPDDQGSGRGRQGSSADLP